MMALGNATPLEPYPGTMKPWRCRCNECGAEVTPRLDGVRHGGQGACRPCGHKRSAAKRRLSEADAIRTMKGIGKATPLEPYPCSQVPWRCQCNVCGRVVTPRLDGVRNRNYLACRACAVVKGANQQRLDPDQAAEDMRRLADVTPLEPYHEAHTPWRCRCNKCGAEVTPRLADIRRGVGACAACGHVKTGLKRRTPEEQAVADMQRLGNATPLEAYPGSRVGWKCRCNECSEVIYPQLGNVRSGQGACLSCAKYGFDTAAPALVYLLHHRRWKAFKVGIAGTSTNRLKDHGRDGWRCLFTLELPTGQQAISVEARVFERLAEMGVQRGYVLRDQMSTGGFTETVSDAAVSAAELRELIETYARDAV